MSIAVDPVAEFLSGAEKIFRHKIRPMLWTVIFIALAQILQCLSHSDIVQILPDEFHLSFKNILKQRPYHFQRIEVKVLGRMVSFDCQLL